MGGVQAVVDAANPAEELRSVYHAVSWQKELGGAGVIPKFGKWTNVSSSFPLHNQVANAELLRRWSKTTTLTVDDLDAIRDLFGEKVYPLCLFVYLLLYKLEHDRSLFPCRSHSTLLLFVVIPSSLSSPRYWESSVGFISVHIQSSLPWPTVCGPLFLSNIGKCEKRT